MKAFIWNTEYEVYVAVADVVERARWILIGQHKKDNIKYIEEEENIQTKHNRLRGMVDDESDFYKVIFKCPDTIIEENQGLIYDHGNE